MKRTYEIRVRNRGSSSAQDVELVAFFTKGIEPVSVDGEDHKIKPGQVVFRTISSLAAGQEIVFTVVARAEKPGVHVIRVQLHCEHLGVSMVEEETTRCYGGSEIGDDATEDADLDNATSEEAPRSLDDSDVEDAS